MRSSSSFVRALIVLVPSLGVACSEDGGAEGDADSRGDVAEVRDGTDASTTDGGDATSPPGTPVLEREGTGAWSCDEELAPTRPADQDWYVQGAVAVGDAVWALRSGNEKLAFTRVGADGAWGTSHALTYGRWVMGGATPIARGSEVTLVWVEEAAEAGGRALRHAVVDTTSGVSTAAHTIVGATSAYANAPSLVRVDDATYLAWGAGDDSGRVTLRFARLSAAGALEGAVDLRTIDQAWNGITPAMVRTGDGFTLAWSEPNAQSGYELWVMRVGDQGEVAQAAQRISSTASANEHFGAAWEAGVSPLLQVGDRTWIVYTRSHFNNDFADPKGGVDLRLAVIDAAGAVTTHDVNTPVDGRSHTQASLSAFGDLVALTWVQGATIYICGGCFVDYDIRHVLLDPDVIVPVSAIVTHTHADHGYRRPMPLVIGDAITTLASQDFHALSYPAAARVACEASP